MKKFSKIIFAIFLLIFFLSFCVRISYYIKEKKVYSQIDKEYSILTKEYLPVVLYLKNYKKQNGVYPEKISEQFLGHSKFFEKYEYESVENGKGYFVKIYPLRGPIEYYYSDESDNGWNYYVGSGYYDGFLDNENFYEIDKTFHAITYDYTSRHGILHKIISFF